MEIRVAYDAWRTAEERRIAVGDRWSLALTALPDERPLRPAESDEPTGLWSLDGEPGLHRLVGDVSATHDHPFEGPWAGIVAGPWRLAVMGRHAGRIAGEIVLIDDSNRTRIDIDELREFATQDVVVAAIQYFDPEYRPVPSRPDDHELVGWRTPVSVNDTHAIRGRVAGVFVLTCRRD